MTITDLITPSSILWGLEGASKKRVLEMASHAIAGQHPSLEADAIFSGLINRERLGSTGIGEGVAIPHCRLGNCDEALGYLIKLDTPIDFDAIDGQPVDLLFILTVPEEACEQHLNTLASLAENFGRASFRDGLRACTSASSLYDAVQQSAH
ncbi:MAG: PTS IIA-like nitrogen regulatory protein PtsN [Marinobacterium sp.]|nr:PTS IIA-like nitrogen regulatory protein PtsN [Marinobacterium sp.]